jgi:hypothetical protein
VAASGSIAPEAASVAPRRVRKDRRATGGFGDVITRA